MLQATMKRTPEGKTPEEFLNEVNRRVHALISQGDLDGDRPEGGTAWLLKPEQFEEYWEAQENLKQTPEVKEKYRLLTQEGKVVVAEIDW